MRIAEGLVELVSHSRWLASHALSFIDPAIQAQYRVDFDIAQEALAAMSKPMAHIERLSEVPPAAFRVLCDGVMLLLVAESVLGNCPPTMHQFLRQGINTGAHDRHQVHLLAVRWLCAAGVVSLDELTAVVFGSGSPDQSRNISTGEGSHTPGASGDFVTPHDSYATSQVASPPRFSSTIELQSALAGHLAEGEPFYLGAHITMLRGVLMRYCSSLVGATEVVSHTDCLAPLGRARVGTPNNNTNELDDDNEDGRFDPRSIDDALLLWIRRVVSLVEPTSPGGKAQRLGIDSHQIEDLYLHTNDGRVLATVIRHYRPDLIPAASIHMLHPLTVWQRQDNWSAIIRAAERLDMWVGIFPEEFVTHGFSTLQLHVLRFVEEIFVVLAGEAEAEFQLMTQDVELDTTTQFVDVTKSTNVALSLQLRRRSANITAMSTNLVQLPVHDNAPTAAQRFIALQAAGLPEEHRDFPQRSLQDPRTSADATQTDSMYEPSPVQDFSAVVAAALRKSFAGSRTAGGTTHDDVRQSSSLSPKVIPAQRSTSCDPEGDNDEVTSPVADGDEDAAPPHDDDDDDGEGYSVILTSMVLQGVAMPIYTKPPPLQAEAVAEPAAAPVIQPHRAAAPEPLEASLTSMGSVAPPADVEAPPRSTSPTIQHSAGSKRRDSEVGGVAAAEPAAKRAPGQGRAGLMLYPANAVNPLARSVAHFKKERQVLSESLRLSATQLSSKLVTNSMNIVQGSRDVEGIDELLSELSNLTIPPTDAPPLSTADNLKAQNMRLRFALEHQQRTVKEAVERLKNKLKRHDFDVVVQHLKQHGRPSATSSPTAAATATAPELIPALQMQSFTPSLNALAFLAAAETAGYMQAARAPPQTAPAQPPSAAVKTPPPVQPARVATAPTPSPIPLAPTPAARPIIVDEDVAAPPASGAKATAFDISVGSSLGVKATAGIPQLQRLKARQAERREQLKARPPAAAAGEEAPPATNAAPPQQTPQPSPALAPLRGAPAPPKVSAVPLPATRSRNNKQLITNALRHVCLTGAVNKPQLDAAVSIVDADDDVTHFVVLLKDEYNKQFRGLYQYRGEATHLQRVFGAGPLQIRLTPSGAGGGHNYNNGGEEAQMPSKLFKFDTGGKRFVELPAVTFNQMTDGITLPPRLRNGKPPL